MRHRSSGLALVAGSALLAGGLVGVAPAHGAKDWKLRTAVVPKDSHCSIPGPERVLRAIGPANVESASPGDDTTFRAFKRAVGLPEEMDRISGVQGVTASYLGGSAGRFAFITLGQVERRGQLKLQYATLTGRRWVTEKGIRVGSKLTRVQQRYGKQAWRVTDPPRKGIWWRLAGHCAFPLFDGEQPVIEARIRNGRVSAFYLWVGAAGE